MPDVNVHFPYRRDLDHPSERKRLGMPGMLAGVEDRMLAQMSFNCWLATNPEAAKKYAVNPTHWSER